MEDNYIYVLVALLPLAACMVVFEVNPYHALVIRGILGAIAALVYAVLGAADVALTEALVGTMLAITLYAVAVRSSLVMRLGVIKNELTEAKCDRDRPFEELLDDFRSIFRQHYMRVELVPYQDTEELNRALMEKEVHATCTHKLEPEEPEEADLGEENDANVAETPAYQTTTRLQRLYEIMETELASSSTLLSYVNPGRSEDKH